MAPSSPPVASQLRQLIYYHLDNNLLKNALFLATRLVAYDSRSGEAAYLLSLCQLQSGFTKAAWDTSRTFAVRGLHLGCCYVFAQACLELGRNLDGIAVLDKSRMLWQNRNTWNQHNESRRQHLPDAAAVLCLKGKLLKAHKNMDLAVECWAHALKLNPMMWDAFIGLCDAGAKVSVPNIYRLHPEMIAMVHAAHVQKSDINLVPSEKSSATNLPAQIPSNNQLDPFTSTQKPNGAHHGSSVLFEKLNNSKISVSTANTVLDEEALNTPSTIADFDDSMLQSNIGKHWDAANGPARRARSTTEQTAEPTSRYKASSSRIKTRTRTGLEETGVLQDPPPPGPPTKRTISGQAASSQSSINGSEPSRRSVRLLSARPPSVNASSKISSFANSLGLREGTRDIKKAKAPVVKSRTLNASAVGRVVSGNRTKTGPSEITDVEAKETRPAVPPIPTLTNHKVRNDTSLAEKDIEALKVILDLMGRLASAQLSLSNYDCSSAIQLYNSLPSSQRETPYVLAQIGKAHYEQAQYAEAEKYFIRVKQLAPSRLEDMEVYSTTLWHLKSEVELAYLAHELIEIERLSPQAWCAIGNSFSLQREHEQALKCFRRATQLDPLFAYGFTLQGHEFIANEEFEKALDAYRCAIAADNRHYNAWYGLGKVYEKMGKWAIAEQHFRTAARINPGNAVLICCIGIVLEKLKHPDRALEMYTRACKLAPKSALSRFKKARCLMTIQEPEQALDELEILKDLVPEEANVWFLMGRLYKMTGRKAEAVRAFTVALNLDPKVSLTVDDERFVQANTIYRLLSSSRMQWKHWMKRTKWLTKTKILIDDMISGSRLAWLHVFLVLYTCGRAEFCISLKSIAGVRKIER